MKVLVVVLALQWATAFAQGPNCPPANAPMSPPPKPGDLPPPPPMPAFPKHFDDPPPPPPKSGEIKSSTLDPASRSWVERTVAQHRSTDGVMEGEDGDVALVLRLANIARVRGAQKVPAFAVDVAKTPIKAWHWLGSVPEGVPTASTRVFEANDRMLLAIEEFDYATAGGAVFTYEGMTNRRIGAYPATLVTVEGKSGCVASTLSWHDAAVSFTLRAAGPLDLQAQRDLLMQVGEAIARTRP